MRRIKKVIKKVLDFFLKLLPFFNLIYFTRKTQTPITFGQICIQKLFRINSNAYWPVHFTSKIINPKNVYCGIDTNPGYMPGCYVQAGDRIIIGDYTQIGPGVGLMSTNHNLHDNRKVSSNGEIEIGKYCWIGKNANILSGVKLGDFTIVGAGAIVTKSFPEGYCVIGGNPAKILKLLDSKNCIRFENEYKYNGYLNHVLFEKKISKYFNK